MDEIVAVVTREPQCDSGALLAVAVVRKTCCGTWAESEGEPEQSPFYNRQQRCVVQLAGSAGITTWEAR